MTSVIVDSWAWVEYLKGTEAGEKVRRYLESGEAYTHSVTISEVISKLVRKGLDIEMAIRTLTSLPRVVETTRASAVQVGELHAKVRKKSPNFSLADAFVLDAAQRLGIKVLTGDPDFEGFEEAEFLR
jgi:PIN domain nuclease of toxin-antitoxin system